MPRRFDWLFKELFLILSAPIFWAVLTNFGRVWRFIDDRYYHAKAKRWREDKKEAKRLHKELIGHYDFYKFQLFGTTENCCRDVLAKVCSCCRRRRKKRRKGTRREQDYKNNSKRTKSDKKEIANNQELKKSSLDDMVNDDAFTGIYMNNINKMYDAKKDDNIAAKKDDNIAVKVDDNEIVQEGKLKNVTTKRKGLNIPTSKDNTVSKSKNETAAKEGLESSALISESASDSTTESSQTKIFKTPLRKGLPSISIDTSPLDSSGSHKQDKRWETIGKHAVLRSKLAPVTPHTFKSDAEVTHNIMYSRSFVNQEEDY
eukprot:g7529.t1